MTRQTGKLRSWNEERGFGFIAPTGGGRELFVHVSALPRDGSRPTPGETLSFEVGQNDKGQPQALKVQREALAGAPLPPAAPRRMATDPRRGPRPASQAAAWGTASLFALPAFLLLYLVLGLLWRLPAAGLLVYAAFSLMTFVAYGLDKAAAARVARRTPESSLHLLALLGGWPGALLAQQLLRHKSVKTAFRRTFWQTVCFNVVGLTLLASPLGAPVRASLNGLI